MSDIIAARDEQEVAEAVRTALGAGKTLEIRGHGSQQALGRPSQTDLTLDLSALSGVTLYEPEELVLSARAGTPRADIEEMVAARGQMLAFEPMDTGPLLGGAAGRGTLGGMFAVNLAGPRRISHGAARDHALGIKAVSGRGEPFKSGGRVVKNVTGYDLPRLMAGAFGTLAIATEITLKVLPRPPMEETVVAAVASPAQAAEALSAAMGSSCEVSGAAFLPEGVLGRLPGFLPGLSGSPALVALRMEGVPPSISARRAMLLKVLAGIGRTEVLETGTSRPLWQAVRDVIPFAGMGERAVWRLSTQPKAGPELATRLAADLGGEAYCDWAGGLVWLCLPGEASHADQVRAALAPFGGHATLIRASAAERARTAVFQPLDGALAALTKRVKESFDPGLVLNPGRMHAGM